MSNSSSQPVGNESSSAGSTNPPSDPDARTQSGGVDFGTENKINITGDVVGRDKNIFTEEAAYNVAGLKNPYLGLRAFTYNDRAAYAGRKLSVEEAVAKLATPGEQRVLLFVTGASGSGKSSFTQACLLPELEAYYKVRGKGVRHAVFRPSAHPIAMLDDALTQLGFVDAQGAKHLVPQENKINVLIIDQFEELFTQSQPDQRDALFEWLTTLPQFDECQMHVIATLRSDYLNELYEIQPLWEIAKQGVELRAMSMDELKEAIQQPLRAKCKEDERYCQKRFERALIDKLAKDASASPTLLPLLQVTLEEIWKKGKLVLANYGTLTDAIKQRADQVYEFKDYDNPVPNEPRSQEERDAILAAFLDLVDVSLDDDYRRDVRISRPLDSLKLERRKLVDDLVRARLLSVTSDSGLEMVNVIHESLINNWDRLKEGVSEKRQHLQQRVRFEQQLKEWLVNGKGDDYLLSGVYLAQARALDHADDVAVRSMNARELLRRSVDRAEAEQRRQLEEQRQRAEEQAVSVRQLRRRAWLLAGAAATTGILTVIALFFFQRSSTSEQAALANAATAQAATTRIVAEQATAQANRSEADQQSRNSRIKSLAAQATSLLQEQYDLGLLLAVESINALPEAIAAEAKSSLLAGLNSHPNLITYLHVYTQPISTVAINSDRKILASGGGTGFYGEVILWDISDSSRPVKLGSTFGHRYAVLSVTFSPDGTALLIVGTDGSIGLWDVSDPTKPGLISFAHEHTGGVASAAFSPDGKWLALGSGREIWLWEVSKRAKAVPIGEPLLGGHVDTVSSLAFSHDGKMLASGEWDGSIVLWNVTNPAKPGLLVRRPTVHAGRVNSLMFSPDGKTLASGGGSVSGEIILWDVSDPMKFAQLGQPLLGSTSSVSSVAFNSSGTRLASGGMDGTIILWDVGERAKPIRLDPVLRGHTDNVNSLVFDLDGIMLASGGADKTIVLWDVDIGDPAEPSRLVHALRGHTDSVSSVVFSSNGKLLATASADKSIQLWDMSDLTKPRRINQPLQVDVADVVSVAFSPDGTLLASASVDKSIHLWDVSDLTKPRRISQLLPGHAADVMNVAFSPDGKTLVSASSDETILLWDVRNPTKPTQLSKPLKHQFGVTDIALSPDGKTLASGGTTLLSEEILLWDISDPTSPDRLSQPLQGHLATVITVAFSPDGKMLASGSENGTIILWNVSDLTKPVQMGQSLQGHADSVSSLAFSPDGKTLASESNDGKLLIWDVSDPAKPTRLGEPKQVHTGRVNGMAFSPDGKILALANSDGTILLLDMDIESWVAQACRVANRNLTEVEWQRYFGDEPYRKTCPNVDRAGISRLEDTK